MLDINIIRLEKALLETVKDKIKDINIIGPKGGITIEAKGNAGEVCPDIVEAIITNKEKLGISLNVSNDFTVTKIDTAFYEVSVQRNKSQDYSEMFSINTKKQEVDENMKSKEIKKIDTEKKNNQNNEIKGENKKMKEVTKKIDTTIPENNAGTNQVAKQMMEKLMEQMKNTDPKDLKKIAALNAEMARLRLGNQAALSKAFMNRCARESGKAIVENKTLHVGMITKASNTVCAMIALKDKQFMPLAQTYLKILFGHEERFGTGTGEYFGLFVDEIMADKLRMDHVIVSEEEQELIINEILSCDLNNINNLRKIFLDINDLFRMYQELTIDAAKKLISVNVTFYTEVMVAASTMDVKSSFAGFSEDTPLTFYRDGFYDIDPELLAGEMVAQTVFDEPRIVFNDCISRLQDGKSSKFAKFVNTEIKKEYDSIKLPDEVKDTFGIGSQGFNFAKDLYYTLRAPYAKATAVKLNREAEIEAKLQAKEISKYKAEQGLAEVKKEYSDFMDHLSNLARFYTEDLNMVEAGEFMFITSNIENENREWKINDEAKNKFFLTVAPELSCAYITKKYGEIDVCGYRALGNVEQLVEGQKLTFINGNAVEVENVYVDSKFDGELEVRTMDEKLYLVKEIEIPRKEAHTPETLTVSMMHSSVVDINRFMDYRYVFKDIPFCEDKFEFLESEQVFENASKVTLVPKFAYTNGKGNTSYLLNAIVCTISDMYGTPIDVPVGQYVCFSAQMEKKIAGLTCEAEKVKRRVSGKTMYLEFEYGNFEEVMMNHCAKAAEEVDNPFLTTEENDNGSKTRILDRTVERVNEGENPLSPTRHKSFSAVDQMIAEMKKKQEIAKMAKKTGIEGITEGSNAIESPAKKQPVGYGFADEFGSNDDVYGDLTIAKVGGKFVNKTEDNNDDDDNNPNGPGSGSPATTPDTADTPAAPATTTPAAPTAPTAPATGNQKVAGSTKHSQYFADENPKTSIGDFTNVKISGGVSIPNGFKNRIVTAQGNKAQYFNSDDSGNEVLSDSTNVKSANVKNNNAGNNTESVALKTNIKNNPTLSADTGTVAVNKAIETINRNKVEGNTPKKTANNNTKKTDNPFLSIGDSFAPKKEGKIVTHVNKTGLDGYFGGNSAFDFGNEGDGNIKKNLEFDGDGLDFSDLI